MDELVLSLSKRPGMYVGQTSLEKAFVYFCGYEAGYRRLFEGKTTSLSKEEEQKWGGNFVAFSIWLCEECFFDVFGDAVGSVAGWANFLSWLADDDAEGFLFLPVLYHEFYLLVQEADGPLALRARLDNVELTMPEQWAINAADGIKRKYEISDKKHAKLMAIKRTKYRALLHAAIKATEQGDKRPLAGHVAACRAFLSEQKVRAAALVREKGDAPAIQ